MKRTAQITIFTDGKECIAISHDAQGNHTRVVNTLGVAYENTYTYDALHMLVGSSGAGSGNSYGMDMYYSPSGRIREKHRDCNSETVSGFASMFYGYCDDNQPHAVRHIFDKNNQSHYDLRWDAAGNLGQISSGNADAMFESGRFLFWTEDNRMHAAVDDRHYSYYAYDHGGERRLKLTGENKQLDVNADFMTTYALLNEPTLYPSAYLVVTNKGYTKHYYAGAERVAARLGGGGLDALCQVAYHNDTLQGKADTLFDQSLEKVNKRLLPENNISCVMDNEFAKDVFDKLIDGIPRQMKAEIAFDHSQIRETVNSMMGDPNNGQETDVYFYHSDHLGSASWITDKSGIAVQHLQYLPFGEPYINQRAAGSTYSERFTFTGKERDEETGYGYFGARYMDYELTTMWLSVDPMSDKYPGISPYAYCAWNPVKLVDPDGREIDDYFTKDGRYLGSDNATTNNVRIIQEDLWNGLEKDEDGKVDHELANKISASFSKASAGMSTDAQLKVYQHYNPRGYSIENVPSDPSSETQSNEPGMTTIVVREGKDNSIVEHLYVRLKNNSTPNRNGDALCDNADEIVSAFIHENNHIERALKMGYKKWFRLNQTKEGKRNVECSAIEAQRAHASWDGCRDSFKKGIEGYEKLF